MRALAVRGNRRGARAWWLLTAAGVIVVATYHGASAAQGWVLRGTLLQDPGRPLAIFQEAASQRARVYGEGSYLPSGWYLLEVRRASVVVRTAQGERELRFGAPLSASTDAGVDDASPVPVARATIERAVADFPGLLKQVRIAPHREGERVTGFAIRYLSPGGLGERLGFRQGDVLTAVNGIPVDGSVGGWDIYDRLKDQEQLAVDLLRGGTPHTVHFQLR